MKIINKRVPVQVSLLVIALSSTALAQTPPTSVYGVNFNANNAQSVAAVNNLRERYNTTTKALEQSAGGNAYSVTPPINVVSDCGADPSGLADSTAAINNCITLAKGTIKRRTVYAPAGTYLITGTINMASGVTFTGDVEGQTLLLYTPATGTALTFASTNFVTLKNMEIRYNNPAYNDTLVTSGSLNTATIQSVFFRGFGATGTLTGAKTLLDMTNAIQVTMIAPNFWGAQTCLTGVNTGGGFSIQVLVELGVYNFCEVQAVFQPELNWTLLNNVFEPTTTGKASGIIMNTVVAEALNVIDCYFSDANVIGNNWMDLLCGGCNIIGNFINNGVNPAGPYPTPQIASVIFENGSRGINFSGNRVNGGEDITTPTCPNPVSTAGSGLEFNFFGNFMVKLVDGTAATPPTTCEGSTLQSFLINANTANLQTLTVANAFSPSGTISALGNFNFRNTYQSRRNTISDAAYVVVNTTSPTGDYGISYTTQTATRAVTATGVTGTVNVAREFYVDDFAGNSSAAKLLTSTMSSGTADGLTSGLVLVDEPYRKAGFICDGTNCRVDIPWTSEMMTCSGTCTANEVLVWTGSAQVANAAATNNLTTIAGVALTSATVGNLVQVAKGHRALVNCDAAVTAGQLVGTSAATAGNVQSGTAPGAGAIVGRSTEATGGTVAGKCIVDLILG